MNLYNYLELKKQVDAAYTILKHDPSSENATRYSTLKLRLQELCVKLVEEEASKVVAEKNYYEEIINNIEEYRACKVCKSELLYQLTDGSFIASGDFVEAFPGWCYDCLVTHCSTTECKDCTIVKEEDRAACSFKSVKEFSGDSI